MQFKPKHKAQTELILRPLIPDMWSAMTSVSTDQTPFRL